MGKGKGGFHWIAMAALLCLLAGKSMAADAVAANEPEDEPIQASADEPIYGDSLEPQQIIVTATRIPTPEGQVANSISVMTAEKMEDRQYRSVIEALNQVPGISVNRSGGPGGFTQVYMRGMDSGRTVVLMDGMPLNDPSSDNGTYDFSALTLDNIGQLEVLRGPQSALYGSSASGGVINLTSKKGEGPATGYVSTEGGSRGAFITRLGSSAGSDKVDYSFAGSYYHTDGVSNIDKRKYGNTEKDAYDQGNFSLRLGANPTEMLRFDLFANAERTRADLDWDPYLPFGTNGDDPYYKVKTYRYMVRPQVTLSLFDGRWEQTVGFGYAQTERKYSDEDDFAHGGYYWRSRYKGETYKFDYKSIVRIHETNTLVAGVDVINESMEFQDSYRGNTTIDPGSVTTYGFYLEDQVNIRDTFFATLGVRHEHHDDFGDKTTWKGSVMYVLPTNTKLKASTGTGFKAPSLYQLHIGNPSWGIDPNPDLKPETSFGWDAGFEQSFHDERIVFGSSFFRNKVKNKIADDYSVGMYNNIELYRTWGIESFARFAITDDISLTAQHTWMRTENDDFARSSLGRRPLHEFSVNVDWKFLEKGTFTAGAKYVGRRPDVDFTNGPQRTVKMPSYTLVRVGAAWEFNDHFEVFGRVENLLNKKYQPTYGYGSEGIGFFAGATLSF